MSDEEEAYRDLIASSSSEEGLSEDEEDGDDGHGGGESQKRIEEMRMKLLSGLEEDKPRKSAGFDDENEASEELDV